MQFLTAGMRMLRAPLLGGALVAGLMGGGSAAWAHAPAVADAGAVAPFAFNTAIRNQPYPGTIELEVDATDLARHIFRVQQRMAVKPGPLKLLFPLWLPGTHSPVGNVSRLAGLVIETASGQRLPWSRDPLHAQAFDVVVPDGVQQLVLRFQNLTATKDDTGRMVMTPSLLNLQWQSTVLYPAGYASSAITLRPRLIVPTGWQAATALRPQGEPQRSQAGDAITFAPVTLEHLIDSPVFAGQHLRRVPLDDGTVQHPVVLNLLGDRPQDIEATPEQIQAHKNLVVQADKLFGVRPYQHYDFLLAISNELGGIGLEHHQSSENGVRRGYFSDWAKSTRSRGLLPHEYVHSWNGKYRRPADLTTPHFNTPMQTGLLWLYEGQTQFWGRVLTTRSGLETLAQGLQNLAQVAATYQGRAGREWRSLQDTTQEGPMLNRGIGKDWDDWQRGADYYDEATLMWIEVDAMLREQTGGAKGIDDFARAFFAGTSGQVGPSTYTFADIVNTLNAVAPRDWAAHLRLRLDAVGKNGVDVDAALARAGWQLVFKPEESAQAKAEWAERRRLNFVHSLGLVLGMAGEVQQVAWESPAYQAALTRGQQIIAVNGQAFSPEQLVQALKDNTGGKQPLELIVKDVSRYRVLRIDHRGGPRYPYLERIDGKTDWLGKLLSPR